LSRGSRGAWRVGRRIVRPSPGPRREYRTKEDDYGGYEYESRPGAGALIDARDQARVPRAGAVPLIDAPDQARLRRRCASSRARRLDSSSYSLTFVFLVLRFRIRPRPRREISNKEDDYGEYEYESRPGANTLDALSTTSRLSSPPEKHRRVHPPHSPRIEAGHEIRSCGCYPSDLRRCVSIGDGRPPIRLTCGCPCG
jgi:hypothetical protein